MKPTTGDLPPPPSDFLAAFSSKDFRSSTELAFDFKQQIYTAPQRDWKPVFITKSNINDFRGQVDVSALAKYRDRYTQAFDFSEDDLQNGSVRLVPIESLVSTKNELEDPKFKAGIKKDPRQTAANMMVKAI